MAGTTRTEPGESRVELRLEASTMALYVSICLLAALAALGESEESGHVESLGVVWGTTLGLALAHLFAFRVSSRLFRGAAFYREDVRVALAQLGGAGVVAGLCSIPVFLFPASAETDAIRLELALLLAIAGYSAGLTDGASRKRALLSAFVVLTLGLLTALAKNILSGH